MNAGNDREFTSSAHFPAKPRKYGAFSTRKLAGNNFGFPRNDRRSRSPEHFRAMNAGNDRESTSSAHFPAESAQLPA